MWVLAVCFIFILMYVFGTRNFDYWEKRGVQYVKPYPFVGTCAKPFFKVQSIAENIVSVYNQFNNEKIIGYFIASKPALVVKDPEIIKQILVTDFAYFYPRGFNPHKYAIEPMMKNLFFADGDLWKLLRQRITPAFTSGKLKAMFPLIVERAERLKVIAAESIGKEVDIRDLMARYTTDFIGACGFGIEADSLNDDNSAFRNLGKRIFTRNFCDNVRAALKQIFTETFKHLYFLDPEVEKITISLVSSIMKQRNYQHSGRNDFIDLLLELKQKGKIVGESIEKLKPDGTPEVSELEIDDSLMAAQVLVFFAAGYETSSSATSYTLHQLAYNPDVQKKCQIEIDEVLKKYDNKISYESVKEMKYLDQTFREGMRMFPSLGFLRRLCAKKYKIPGTNVTIDEGVVISIPLIALHNDAKHFDNPKEFRPERFSPENVNDITKHVYLPFGAGPRACIGERLGLMQSLAGLAAILSEFSVSPSENSLRWPITDPKSTIVQIVKDGLPLHLNLRNK